MRQPDRRLQRPNQHQLAATLLPLLWGCTALLAWYENDAYVHSVLRLTSWKLSQLDSWLVLATIFAKSLVLIAVPVAVAFVVSKRFGAWSFWLLAGVVPLMILGYIGTDMRIKVITGQSLEYYLRRAISQHALQWGGDGKRYLVPLLLPLIAGGLGITIGFVIRARVEDLIARIPVSVAKWMTRGGLGISFLIFGLVLAIRPFANQPAALMRLHQQFPCYAAIFHPSTVAPTGKAAFNVDVRQSFSRLAESFLKNSRTGDVLKEVTLPPDSVRPHVVLLILESFRFDSIRADAMPKLSTRAESGYVASHHLSGSNCSPQGAFSLLYGQYATRYDAVLNHGNHPVLCDRWKASGYTTYLAASCIFDYRRMDEMFSALTFDEADFASRPRDQWPQADRETLQNIADRLAGDSFADAPHESRLGSDNSNEPHSMLAVGYLMSTHYDYQYPEEYENLELQIDSGNNLESNAYEKNSIPEGISRRTLLSRYHRSLRFMDDALDQFLSEIDLDRTIVVITGDHGESLYDDGVLSHGSRLSVVQTRTPFVILGAGVSRQRRTAISSHVDLIPTLWQLCGGERISDRCLHGRSLIMGGETEPENGDKSHTGLLVHEFPDSWDLMAIRGHHRLIINQSRTHASLSVLGFANESGLINSKLKQPESEVNHWVEAFEPLAY